jgi:hypothetical protein
MRGSARASLTYSWVRSIALLISVTRGRGARVRTPGKEKERSMIRNLKTLLLAALAVTALGALAASAAQAHPEFTAQVQAGKETTVTALPDGTGKTAHHVFDIRKGPNEGVLSITCNEFTADGVVSGSTFSEVTVTPHWGKTVAGVFKTECNFVGQEVEVNTGACDLVLTATETVIIKTDTKLVGECKHGKQPITFNNTTLNCHVEVGEQTITGIKYHNFADGTVTVESTALAVQYNATGVGCPYGTKTNGQFTTGNTILTGEDITGAMVPLSWHA